MCTTCGCGAGELRLEEHASHEHEHRHADRTMPGPLHVHAADAPTAGHEAAAGGHGHFHRHADGSVHGHPYVHGGEHAHRQRATASSRDLHFGLGPAGAHAPGMSQARMVQIEQDILAKNDRFAARNRRIFADHGILALNLVSSPGSGKTTLLVRTIEALAGRLPTAVVEGDQQTSVDADRIRATGVPAVQINTGKGCHLDASIVGSALDRLALADEGILFI